MIINFLVLRLTDFVNNHLSLCLSLVTIILTGCYHWKRRHFYSMASEFDGPPGLPIVGNAFLWTKSMKNTFSELNAKYKSPFRVWIGPKLFVVISRPEDLEIIFNSRHAVEKASVYEFMKPFLGEGLLTTKANQSKRKRKILAPVFTQRTLNTLIPIFLEKSKILVASLEKFVDCGVFDIFPFVKQCTLDTICETAMGIQLNSESDKTEYLECFTRLMKIGWLRMCRFWLYPDIIWKRTKVFKESIQLVSKVNEVACQIIEKRRTENKERKTRMLEEKSNSAPVERKAFLQHLIEISEIGVAYTDDDILDEVNTFLVGGTDTSAAVIGFTLIMLGMHPQIQDQIFTEVNGIFEGNERSITYENLSQMEHLERVIKETMRIYPVAAITARSITEDIPLDTCTLPKGSECIICTIRTHRDPQYWPNPLEFNPDRFLPEEVSKRHPFSYIPFSGGARMCIGFKYAMMSMKILISTVVRSYEISTDYKEVADVKITPELVIRASNGSRIKIKRRTT